MNRILRTTIILALLLCLAIPASAAVVLMGNRGVRMDWAGLSTDTKPTSNTAYGSTYYETDTLTPYVYTGAGWVVDYRSALLWS